MENEETKKIEEMRKAHHDGSVREKYHTSFGGTYIRDLVYGANDGIVTTFAVVAGVAGAQLDVSIILILGFANLFADGLSMAIGNYLGTKSEQQYMARERAMEEWEVAHLPEEERDEIRVMYREKGFTGDDLERAVAIITADKKRWVDEMMRDELGILAADEDPTRPFKNALTTFIAFFIAGFLPLIPYVIGISSGGLLPSACVSGLALFIIGSMRSIITKKSWWIAGIEMLAVGGLAAGAAYGVGASVERFF